MHKKFLISLVMVGAMSLAFAPVALAQDVSQDQSQELSQELELECSTQSYGQTKCWAKGSQDASQEQSQQVVLGDSVVRLSDGTLYHQPVDTGLDTVGIVAAAGTLVSGVAASVYRFKNRAA